MFRFLLTTDNHLGYKERDPRQAPDSFISFEECLRAARCDFNVDAMLLSGDLFHENKPSLACMKQTMSIMRKYVMGDRPVEFAMVSDPAASFERHPIPCANFQDPNSNIALPIFSIHGNHDDPVGGTGALDLLAHAGLINYFGHSDSLDNIVVRPILLRKGDTYIALYGLGNVRDERLHRCFELQKVKFVQPKEDPEKWFRILLFHQNRGVRTTNSKGGIHESMLFGFKFDLVIWGNEHEQLMAPQPSGNGEFDIIQPGSTIRTSLTAGESNPKMFGVLEVRGRDYRVTAYPLQSVRPAVRRTVELWKERPPKSTEAVEELLRGVADKLIEEAEAMIARIPADVLHVHPNIKYPLMRIAVDYHDPDGAPFPQPNASRFGQQFLDVIVNPDDCLKPIKPPPAARSTHLSGHDSRIAQPIPDAGVSVTDIRTKVTALFNANAAAACTLLSEPEVSTAVYSFVEKGESAAIDAKIDTLIKESLKSVWLKVREQADFDAQQVLQLALANKEETNKRFAREHGTEEGRPLPAPGLVIDNDLPLGAPLPRSHAELPAAGAPGEDGDFDFVEEPVSVQVSRPAHAALTNVDEDEDGVGGLGDDVVDLTNIVAARRALAPAAPAAPTAPAPKRTRKTAAAASGDDGTALPKSRAKREPPPAPQLALTTAPLSTGHGAPSSTPPPSASGNGAAELLAKW